MSKQPPKFLLIDAGNTRFKWAVTTPRGRIIPAGDIAAKDATTVRISELAKKYPKYRTIVASVVPKLVPVFRRTFAGRIHIVSGASPALGLHFDYPKPSELGADRVAVAVAVHAEGVWPAIIIATGTATAFTVLDAKGRLCGGAIAPGLQAQLTSLLGATAQLPETKLQRPRSALAKSTQDAIRAGVIINFQGGVNETLRQLSAALPGGRPHIVLTGGNADYLTGSLDLPHTLRPLLVFEGLLIIGTRLDRPTK